MKKRKQKRQRNQRRKLLAAGASLEERRLANLTGGTSEERKRKHYKVDRFPPAIQQMIAEQYAAGVSFRDIAKQCREAGYPIGKDALGRYWRAVWKEEHEELRRGRLALVVIKRALELEPKSESRRVAEEILYTLLCGKLREMKQQPWDVLLREAREQEKTGVGRKRGSNGKPERHPSAVEQGREIRRRWRRLYGLEEADDTQEPQG
jgi:hypothetical protein